MSSESDGQPPSLLSGGHPAEPSQVPEVEDTDIEEHDEIDDDAVEPPAADPPQPELESHDALPAESPRQDDHVAPTQIVATADGDNPDADDDSLNPAGDVTPAPTRSLGPPQRKGLVRATAVATPGQTTAPAQPRKRPKPLLGGLNRGVSTLPAPNEPETETASDTAEAQAEPESPQHPAEPDHPESNQDESEAPPKPAPQRKRLKKLDASSSKSKVR